MCASAQQSALRLPLTPCSLSDVGKPKKGFPVRSYLLAFLLALGKIFSLNSGWLCIVPRYVTRKARAILLRAVGYVQEQQVLCHSFAETESLELAARTIYNLIDGWDSKSFEWACLCYFGAAIDRVNHDRFLRFGAFYFGGQIPLIGDYKARACTCALCHPELQRKPVARAARPAKAGAA